MRKNKIRILHVAQAAGGVDRYIRMLLKYLDKEKFENILVCSQDFHEEDYRAWKMCIVGLTLGEFQKNTGNCLRDYK